MEVCDTKLLFGNYLMKLWFLSPGTVDTGARIAFVVGLSCALWDVEQYP